MQSSSELIGETVTNDNLVVNGRVGIATATPDQPLVVMGTGNGGYYTRGHISWLNPTGDLLGMLSCDDSSHPYGVFGIAGDSTIQSRIAELDAVDRSRSTGGLWDDLRGFTLSFERDGPGWAAAFISMNLPTNAIMHVTGNHGGAVGIFTRAPQSKLSVNGNVAIGSYAASTPAPSGGLIVSGYVGVGTSSPREMLDVAGNVDVAGTLNAYQLVGNAGGLTNLQGASVAPGSVGTAQANLTDWNAWGDNRYLRLGGGTLSGALVVNGGISGNGSGLTSLQGGSIVAGTVGTTQANLAQWNAWGDGRFLNLTNGGTVQGPLTVNGTITGNGSGLTSLQGSAIASGTVGTTQANLTQWSTWGDARYLNLSTGGTVQGILTTTTNIIVNGRIGVATNAPAERLHVAGNIRAEGQFIGNGSGLYVMQQGDLSMGSFTNGLPQ
jgi:hypothetical protein